MSGDTKRLAAALQPLIARVRADITASKNAEGRQVWTREPLTPERVAKHLNGGPARGVCVIKEGESTTMVGMFDLDSHKGETTWPRMLAVARELMDTLQMLGGAPIVFRSSGGKGIHLYVVWDRPQDAYSVRMWLTDVLRSCGYENGTKGVGAKQIEIFPKQSHVPVGGSGSQAILPLAGLSVPIVFEPLLDDLVLADRESLIETGWPASDPVPVRVRPERVARPAGEIAGLPMLKSLIDAIPNSGERELSYDEWRSVMFALHHETDGAPEGLSLLHEISSRASVYNEEKTDRDWGYARSEGRENAIGVGTLKRIAGGFGWHEPLDASAFEDISAQDDRPPTRVPDLTTPAAVAATTMAGAVLVTKLSRNAPLPRVKRRGIPEAHYLTTDQANAQRLKNAFGSMVFVAAGKWHVWDGKRWVADEGDVYRYACRLSDLVREEARPFVAKAADADARGDSAKAKQMKGIADALGKWALKCEMKGTIEAAVGLARKMLTVDSQTLDRDPWALNCLNGVVDLRTGVVRAHDPGEYITKLVPIAYDPDAVCPLWESVLSRITLEHELVPARRGIARFLQRWFGYCLTGKTVEQCFVVHWGAEGSNGKSTVLGLMADTLGDYASTAAPGLLTASKNDRHPTEIAALFGRRMTTAHETSENVVLREDFIKQATGGDKLTARFMREDFFEFEPTHKLQLLTNHKPTIKGQDGGIWRRVQLVPYLASFGDPDEVASGRRMFLRDVDMPERLRDELPGILAWRVRGAVEWTQTGLQAPAGVKAASEAYKTEQDRIGQFVGECCELGPEFEEALTTGGGMDVTDGLYPEYVRWCKEGGTFPLSKVRFMDDVLRVVPRGAIVTRNLSLGNGKRREVRIVRGMRLAIER